MSRLRLSPYQCQQSYRYLTAFVSTGLALWVRSALHPWLKEECPFSLFYLSVLLTAWLAGTGPAMLAIALGTASAAFFFIEPRISLRVDSLAEIIQLGIYVFVNCVATGLFDRLERQRLLAEQRSQENSRLSASLRQADERKDEYLALLAHELRNPLAPIRSGLVVLEREANSVSTVHHVRRILERHTGHLVRLTQDLLDISRISRGKIVLQRKVMSLQDAIDDAVEMIQEQMQERRHHFQLLVPDHAVLLDGDRVRLAQLIANLLGNAAKYTPDGGRIVLELDVEDRIACLSVRDNGVGFAADQSEKIFLPFTQVDPSRTREHGGLGLGLSIVKKLAELHGGTVIANSRGPGLGAMFSVQLPVIVQDFPVPDLMPNVVEQIPEPASCSPQRILLVEDSPDAAELLSSLLRDDGYTVLTASDGLEALRIATEQDLDVCLLDIGLPGMDGYEVARRIRRSLRGREVKLIALTGWGSSADREMTSEAGFNLHLVKPVAYADLVEVLRTGVTNDGQMAFVAM